MIEVIVDRRMVGCEFLQTSHLVVSDVFELVSARPVRLPFNPHKGHAIQREQRHGSA